MDGRMEKGGMGSVDRTGARTASRASQQLRIHLLHDFEMADGLQDGNVMPRRAARDQSYDFHHWTAMQSEIRNT